MKKYILLILLISFIYSRRNCLQEAERDILGRSSRPEKDTLAISPSRHFYIHYDKTGNAAPDFQDSNPENGIPDYVDEVGIMADSARHVLVNLMGFSSPPADEDSIYDIYIESYSSGVYGYNRKDSPSQNTSGATSYLQIDNDYSGFNSIFNLTPKQIMKITVGHEYFHGIQWGYVRDVGVSQYFYEMTSMWFEDVLIPDGNDYLDGFADPFLNDPTADFFDNTGGGYELALFGHYLSSFIDLKGQLDATQSTIIREIWERYRDSSTSAFSALKYILQDPSYNTSFIEVWVDFVSRNLYNGLYDNMENPFYYYIDQALIEPIQPIQKDTDPQMLEDKDTLVLSLNNKSTAIQSYQIGESGLLSIDHLSVDYVGRVSIISTSDYNDLFMASDMNGLELTSGSDIHFVYGSENQGSVTIDIIYNPSCFIVDGGSVWPGNTNADSIVNPFDILPIGIYWNQSVCERSEIANDIYKWEAQPLLLDNCIAHADSNGDGVVDIADILAIMINWGYETSNNDGIAYVVAESCSNVNGDLSRYYSNFSQIYNSLTGNSNAEIQIRNRLEVLFGFSSVPSIYQIYHNYPNPFNPITSIPYFISKKSEVSLSVFDLMGRQVIHHGSFIMPEGSHEMIINGQNLTSGVYMYQFRINGTELMPKKMVLLK